MSNRQELMDAIHRRKPARIPYTFDARPETQELLRAHLGLNASANLAEHFGCNTFDSLWSALGKNPALFLENRFCFFKNNRIVFLEYIEKLVCYLLWII